MKFRTGRSNIICNVWTDAARQAAVEVRKAKLNDPQIAKESRVRSRPGGYTIEHPVHGMLHPQEKPYQSKEEAASVLKTARGK